jgi:hypothetical protein
MEIKPSRKKLMPRQSKRVLNRKASKKDPSIISSIKERIKLGRMGIHEQGARLNDIPENNYISANIKPFHPTNNIDHYKKLYLSKESDIDKKFEHKLEVIDENIKKNKKTLNDALHSDPVSKNDKDSLEVRKKLAKTGIEDLEKRRGKILSEIKLYKMIAEYEVKISMHEDNLKDVKHSRMDIEDKNEFIFDIEREMYFLKEQIDMIKQMIEHKQVNKPKQATTFKERSNAKARKGVHSRLRPRGRHDQLKAMASQIGKSISGLAEESRIMAQNLTKKGINIATRKMTKKFKPRGIRSNSKLPQPSLSL